MCFFLYLVSLNVCVGALGFFLKYFYKNRPFYINVLYHNKYAEYLTKARQKSEILSKESIKLPLLTICWVIKTKLQTRLEAENKTQQKNYPVFGETSASFTAARED